MKFVFIILALYLVNTLVYLTYLSKEMVNIPSKIVHQKISFQKANHVHPHKPSLLKPKQPYIKLVRDLPRRDMP